MTRAVERVGAGAPGELPAAFVAAMDDDLNTSAALAALHEVLRDGNNALAGGDDVTVRTALASVRAILDILGVDPLDPAWTGGARASDLRGVVDSLIALALEQRAQARIRRDWAAPTRCGINSSGPVWWSRTPHRGRVGLLESRTDGRQFAAPWSAGGVEGQCPEGVRWKEPGLPRRARPDVAGDERPWHKAYSGTEKLPQRTAWKQEKERRAAAEEGRAPKIGQPGSKDTTWGKGGGRGTANAKPARGKQPAGRSGPRVAPGRKSNPAKDSPELLVGRNPVLEALRTQVPATALYTALGIDIDDRVKEIVRTAADRGIAILEISRAELDRMTGGVLHQGVGLQVPPFAYEPFEDLVAAVLEHPAPLLVALDGVTDPRNLGAVIRSAAAFGAQASSYPSGGRPASPRPPGGPARARRPGCRWPR